ncbi:hypothetical protein FRC00_013851 [Tulasnella sp. 408]|nr:hypothetical protein FRC00_013851 [Tulasnella sp. 408]
MTLNRNDKTRIAHRLADAFTCIPTGNQGPLTKQEVYTQLGVSLVSIIYDEHTGWSWVLADGQDAYLFLKSRLESESLQGYTTRKVQRSDGEWARLEQKLKAEIESRKRQENTSGTSGRNNPAIPQPTASRSLPSQTNPAESLSALEGTNWPSSSSTSNVLGRSGWSIADASVSHIFAHKSTVSSQTVPQGPKVVPPLVRPKVAQPPRKKQRTKGPASWSLLQPDPARLWSLRQPDAKRPCPFKKLPVELIEAVLEECFEGLETRREHVEMAHTLDSVSTGIRQVLRGLPSLWAVIHPALPAQFTKRAISLSPSRPLSIEYVPKPAQSKGWQKFGVFIQLVEEARDRWDSLDVTVNPMSLATLIQALETPAPILHSLRVSTTYTEQVDDSQPISPFRLLDGKQGYLRRLELNKTPCAFDPTPFTLLTSMILEEGVYTRYQDVLDFLTSCSQLEELHLADLNFTDGPPRELEQPLVLPQLKQLTLADGVARVGIIKLYHSIRADNCERLTLKVRGVAEMDRPELVERFVPVVQRILETESQTALRFSRHKNLSATFWEGAGAIHSFCLGFIGDALAHAMHFPSFINRVLPPGNGAPQIKLNVEGMMSGLTEGRIGFDVVEAMPTVLASRFQSLTVTEVVAQVVVDRHFGCLQEFIAPGLQKGLPALRRITLQAVPSETLVMKPESAAAGRGLEEFIDAVSQAYYEVAPGGGVPAQKRNSITVLLEGRFGVNASTRTALVDGGDGARAGIRIVASKAKLHCTNL